MTYIDTLLTPEAGYTYVNNNQFYTTIATALTANGWVYVEAVDQIVTTTTYRKHVWRAPSANTGLPSDFYVVFQVSFTTAGTVYPTTTPVYAFLCEGYSGGTISKPATNNNSVTLAADLTNPATAALSTQRFDTSFPSTFFGGHCSPAQAPGFGLTTNLASQRFMALVTKDTIITNCASGGGNTASYSYNAWQMLYIGAYESYMSSAVDPMPILMMTSGYRTTSSNLWTSQPPGGCTRAPTFTPSTAYTEVFGVLCGYNVFMNAADTSYGPYLGGAIGNWGITPVIGAVGNTSSNWYKNMSGPLAAKVPLSMSSPTGSGGSKTIFRGYLKYMAACTTATHSAGDTFLIDGKVYSCFSGNTGTMLVNTEA